MLRSVLFTSSLLAILSGCAPTSRSEGTSESRFDSIELVDLNGATLEIRPEDRKATVFLFARTDCPISNRYAPTVRQLCHDFSDRDVAFYLVYVDPQQAAAEIAAHRKDYSYPCTALCDRDHHFVERVGGRVTPEAVVIDGEGQLIYRGRIDDRFVDFGKTRQQPTQNDLALALKAVLAGRAIEVPVTRAVGCFIGDLKAD